MERKIGSVFKKKDTNYKTKKQRVLSSRSRGRREKSAMSSRKETQTTKQQNALDGEGEGEKNRRSVQETRHKLLNKKTKGTLLTVIWRERKIG